jgi:imidazolonepropionase-like amidohydrolase
MLINCKLMNCKLPAIALCVVLILGLMASAGHTDDRALALVGAKVYPSPTAAPILDAVVITSGGVITAIGGRGEIKIPPDAHVIDCSGKAIVAGFWNSHVHFTQTMWKNAANASAGVLEAHMREMLTRWGFTTVWDLGSDPYNSLALRRRVESGEVPGPQIRLTGLIFQKGGHPAYVPAELQLPEASTPQEAARMARDELQLGLDGMKLFTGSYMGNRPVVNMDAAVARAAVDVAHAQGKPVFAHPQNRTGVDVALAAGVDVLAHTIPTEPGYTTDELAQFKSQGTALIPTLSIWMSSSIDPAVTEELVRSGGDQLKAFSAIGGLVLFGTDVGFFTFSDPSVELELMNRALSETEILASLTTNPASYFKAGRKGRLEQGFDADLVVLDGDPAANVRNFAKIVSTIRAGQVIYSKP